MRVRSVWIVALAVLSIVQRGRAQDAAPLAIDTPMTPPAWALAERAVIRANADAVKAYADRLIDARGYLPVEERWGVTDGPDDLMENIRNWPLAHAAGGADSIVDTWLKAWEGHLDQFGKAKIPQVEAAKDGIFYKEFTPSFDWEHISEGFGPFYFYGLSRPGDTRHQARMKRFSGLYMNEDPEAQNYDPKLKIIKSLFNGSKGPKLTPATADDWDGPAPPGTDPKSPTRTRFLTSANVRGDHPLNMNAAMLPFHAYMLTGEEKYRNWVLEYIGAWRDRTLANGGNIPSNIGLDGKVGGEWGGKWYGGVFGWNSPDEGIRNYVFRGPPEAFGAALLLTGDQGFAQVMRGQIDNLYKAAKTENGKLTLPRFYGDQGWYGYYEVGAGPSGSLGNLHNVLVDLYMWSLLPSDLERLPKTGWTGYLQTADPAYPLAAFESALADIRRGGQRLRGEAVPDAAGRGAGGAGRAGGRGAAGAAGATGAAGAPGAGRGGAGRGNATPRPPVTANPVQTTALINLTMGANDPGGSTHGPLPLHAVVRHFDPERKRAGLPEDVAALVEKIQRDAITLTLVNTNPMSPRTVQVQMGAYGEHHATSITLGQRTIPVEGPSFTVRLAAGAGATMTVGLRRHEYRPTLAFPWDRGPARRQQSTVRGAAR